MPKKNPRSAGTTGARVQTITGRLTCHRDGYGFVIPEDRGLGGDVFIPPHKLLNATHGDQVMARILTPSPARRRKATKTARQKLEGEIIRVLSRASDIVVGKVIRYRNAAYVAPLDERYHYTIRLAHDDPTLEGQVVAVSIVVQPRRGEPPLGELREVLGHPDDPEIQYKIVCHNHRIPMRFPPVAQEEVKAARPPDAREMARRKDFRQELTVTIDGETARDFDDAVSIRRREDGSFELGVHIADVSHYVRPDSRLDQEALFRGTSVYFPDRAVPMLPEPLSNNLCSLKPGEDRLTVSVLMQVDRRGEVQEARFYNSVIRSRQRMTYTDVRKILIDRDAALRKRYGPLVKRLEWMLELCEILRAKRLSRGALDFDLPEADIEYDVNGEVLDIVRCERNEAHRIIEEFMLLANETVAVHLVEKGVPVLFRIHEGPDAAKVENFLEIARSLGYGLEQTRKGGYHPRDFQKLMERLAGKREQKFLSYLMLRSFKQARYSEENAGHFGLATENYTHFTSPIRRYPDLVVQRILKGVLEGQPFSRQQEELYGRLHEIAIQSSERERRADEAEREIMRWLMAAFMAERLGEEYEAFIIGVKTNGFFVELFDHFVEGFVPVQAIGDDYYLFHERGHCLIGENTGKVYRLGGQVRVRVDKVNRHRHLIDFSVVLPERPAPPKRM